MCRLRHHCICRDCSHLHHRAPRAPLLALASGTLAQGLFSMAEIVLGIGTSHGPLLSTPPEQWDLRAKADRVNKAHYFRGKSYDYESLLRERAPGFAKEA